MYIACISSYGTEKDVVFVAVSELHILRQIPCGRYREQLHYLALVWVYYFDSYGKEMWLFFIYSVILWHIQSTVVEPIIFGSKIDFDLRCVGNIML